MKRNINRIKGRMKREVKRPREAHPHNPSMFLGQWYECQAFSDKGDKLVGLVRALSTCRFPQRLNIAKSRPNKSDNIVIQKSYPHTHTRTKHSQDLQRLYTRAYTHQAHTRPIKHLHTRTHTLSTGKTNRAYYTRIHACVMEVDRRTRLCIHPRAMMVFLRLTNYSKYKFALHNRSSS